MTIDHSQAVIAIVSDEDNATSNSNAIGMIELRLAALAVLEACDTSARQSDHIASFN